MINNSTTDISISLIFATELDHVTTNVRSQKVKGQGHGVKTYSDCQIIDLS